MSLIAWYPLNGNTNDYSGNGYHLTGSVTATVDTGGKIGSCYLFASGQRIMNSTGMTFSGTTSTTAWGYATGYSPSSMLFSYNAGPGPDLYFDSSTIVWNLGDGATYPFKNGGVNVVQPSLNTWHHYAVINDQSKNKCTLYVDGLYYGETIWRSTVQTNAGFTIGNYYPSSTGYAWIGKINDIRVYNHALNEDEIQDIFNTKILHYTFDEPEEPTENIVALSGYDAALERSGTGYPYTMVDITAAVRARWTASNNKITISFEGKRDGASGYPEAFIFFSDWTFALVANTTSSTWTFVSNTTTLPDPSTKTVYFAVYHMPASSSGLSYSRKHQVEFKDRATAFVNGTRRGIINDNSGFRNHAYLTMPYSPKWSSESKIGKGSYYFNNQSPVGYYYYIQSAKEVYIPQQFTLSAWIRGSTSNQPANNIYPFGWANLCTNGPSGGVQDTRSGIIYYDTASTYTSWDPGGKSFYDNNWHLWTITYDGVTGQIKQYKDGVLTDTGSVNNIYHLQTHRMFLVGSAWALTYGGHEGFIDDVRVYATPLSSTRILNLYENTTKIYKNQNHKADIMYTPTYRNKLLTLDYRTWQHGQTGSVGLFVINGSAAENVRENDLDPWGKTTPIWKTRPEGNNADDGGWNTTAVPIDSNFTYRFSVWIKRPTAQTGGSFYLGLNPPPLRNDNSAIQDNPYFYYGAQSLLAENTWYLLVGHCFYQGYTGGAHQDSGWYTTSGKIETLSWGNVGTADVKWNPGTTTATHRTYHYYTTNTASSLYFAYPRLDKINGQEPSIQQLLNGYDSILSSYNDSNYLNKIYFLGKEYLLKKNIDDGLIAYYPFNNDANDYSIYSNDCTVVGASLTSGIRDNGYSFNGTNNYMYSKTALLNRTNGQALTVSCWIKAGAYGSRYQEIIANRDASNYNWMLYRHTTDGSLQLHGSAQNKSSYIPPLDTWVHIVAVVNSSGVYNLYANTILQQTVSGFTYGAASTQLSIGYFPNTEYYLGLLDEVRIYNRALSEEEIKIIYDLDKPDGPAMKIKSDTIYTRNEVLSK